MGGISDRHQEIRRRRKRKVKYALFARRLKKATASEKAVLIDKIRKLTPGCEQVIENLGLAKETAR